VLKPGSPVYFQPKSVTAFCLCQSYNGQVLMKTHTIVATSQYEDTHNYCNSAVLFSVLYYVLCAQLCPVHSCVITWSVQNNYLVCYALLCCSSSRLDWNVQPRPHNSWYTSKLLIAYVFQQTEFSVHFLLSLIFSYQEWQTQRSYLYKTPRALCN